MIRNKVIFLLGMAAYLLPESATLSILLVVATTMIAAQKAKPADLFIYFSLALAALFQIIPAPFSTAIIAALALFIAGRKTEAFIVLFLQVTLIASLEAILGGALYKFHIEAAAPAILTGLIILAAQSKVTLKDYLILLTVPLITSSILNFVLSPTWLMIVAAFPILILGCQFKPRESYKSIFSLIGFSVSAILISWLYSFPSTSSNAYFLLPQNTNSPEFKYYENYAAASKFTGIDLIEIKNPKDIPDNSLLVLPWLTEELDSDYNKTIKSLANKRHWTVILVGEHTNMNGVANRINTFTGFNNLRDDLTTPPENKDNSGALRVSGTDPWLQSSLLNRGASVAIHSIFDKVLLSGDGWWAENNIGEWLWVGDYVWQPKDRNGRLVLAAQIVDDGAHWVVVGDSTPFLNKAILAQPISTKEIIKLASLWPVFLKDVLLVFLMVVGGIVKSPIRIRYASLLATVPILIIQLIPQAISSWDSVWIGENAFTESNFNNHLSKSKPLLETKWQLIRTSNAINEDFFTGNQNAVIFGIVKEGVKVDGITFTNCHRIGNIQTDEGPLLMNAQACKVSGNAKAIIGTNDEAAAILYKTRNNTKILILDQNFLAQGAKKENVEWLLKNIK